MEPDGDSAFRSWRSGKINSATSQNGGAVYIPDQDTTDVGRIFSSRLSYNKPSMVLHMLRRKLGDATFFQGMQEYLSDPNLAYGYAKTPDFVTKMENVSSVDLTEFFDDWIYNQGYPSYSISWHQINATQVSVQINQTQSHASVSYFEAPVPIRLHGANNEVLDVVLDNTSNGENFLVDVTSPVTLLLFDPELHLISKNNSVVLGIDEVDMSSSFLVVPNPTKLDFLIEKPDDVTISRILIYDALGRIVLEPKVNDIISVESISSGFHFVTFETNKGLIRRTLIKQ